MSWKWLGIGAGIVGTGTLIAVVYKLFFAPPEEEVTPPPTPPEECPEGWIPCDEVPEGATAVGYGPEYPNCCKVVEEGIEPAPISEESNSTVPPEEPPPVEQQYVDQTELEFGSPY